MKNKKIKIIDKRIVFDNITIKQENLNYSRIEMYNSSNNLLCVVFSGYENNNINFHAFNFRFYNSCTENQELNIKRFIKNHVLFVKPNNYFYRGLTV